ncbi:unnamed protein product [Allacma fusca]|uniref:Uncharacterized protein n=1 Tax=Allacma fusca TaxID=39272 RepID=A0A8J2NRL5_9HEXA|nr:unnamed protein product [Allacma fusca]
MSITWNGDSLQYRDLSLTFKQNQADGSFLGSDDVLLGLRTLDKTAANSLLSNGIQRDNYTKVPQDQFYPELNEHYDIFRRVNSVTVRDGGIVPVLFAPEDARLERPWTDDVPKTSNQPAPVPCPFFQEPWVSDGTHRGAVDGNLLQIPSSNVWLTPPASPSPTFQDLISPGVNHMGPPEAIIFDSDDEIDGPVEPRRSPEVITLDEDTVSSENTIENPPVENPQLRTLQLRHQQ